MIAALLVSVVVVTAMAGIAAADQINVFEPGTFVPGVGGAASGIAVANIQLVPGGAPVIKDLVVWNFNQPANTQHTLTTVVAPLAGGGVHGDIIVTYSEKTLPCAIPGCCIFAPGPKKWVQDMGMYSSVGPTVLESLDIAFAAAPGVIAGNNYQVQVTDNNGLPLTVQVTIVATTVPEFATIAIPAAAILGLFFFFNYRRQRRS